MNKVLLFWPQLKNYKDKEYEQKDIAYKKDKHTTFVDWERYHVINSKKWIINDLLSKIELEIVEDCKNITNEKIIVISHNLKEISHALEEVTKDNKIFLIHLGDEFFSDLNNSLEIYKKCTYVFRPYFFFSNLKNILHIPVGYKSSENFYDEKKTYKWSFMGSVYKSSRHDMIDVFKKNFDNFFLHQTDHFADKKSLNSEEMYKIISSSTFSLCPQGFNHPETYRLWEILENKSIPIIQDTLSIYDKILPNNNLIKVKYWSEFLAIEKEINAEEILKKNLDWYNSYKTNLKNKIFGIIYEQN